MLPNCPICVIIGDGRHKTKAHRMCPRLYFVCCIHNCILEEEQNDESISSTVGLWSGMKIKVRPPYLKAKEESG